MKAFFFMLFSWLFSKCGQKLDPKLPTRIIPTPKPPKETGAYVPIKGTEWNPMLNLPRNGTCYCGSKRKFKVCCLPKEPLAIDAQFVADAKPLVKKLRSIKKRT